VRVCVRIYVRACDCVYKDGYNAMFVNYKLPPPSQTCNDHSDLCLF